MSVLEKMMMTLKSKGVDQKEGCFQLQAVRLVLLVDVVKERSISNLSTKTET